jgi:rubrerythrin
MDRKLTSLEVLGMAIRSEEDAVKFYGHIADMINNEMVRDKYRHLAKEEANHRKMLIDLYKKMSGGHKIPSKIPGEPETAEGGAVPEQISHSLEDLLILAVKREQEAREFYRKAAAAATDLSGKRILEYLVHVEKGHEMMLKSELEAYLRDKRWYTGGEASEMIHAGP